MYEIWLALNIGWEVAHSTGPWLPSLDAVLGLAWAAALWQGTRSRWAAGFKVALVVAAATALLTFLLLPNLAASSLKEVGYWLDALVLVLIAIGFGGLAGLLAWPLAAVAWGWRRGSPQRAIAAACHVRRARTRAPARPAAARGPHHAR